MALKLNRSWRPFVPEWAGNTMLPRLEQIRLKYRTLTVEDVFRAQEEVDIDLLSAQEITRQDMKSQKKYWDFMRHVVSKYTSDWEGVEVDGEPVTDGGAIAADISMGSMDLFGEVVTRIIGESLGTAGEAKNSNGQSAPESSGSGTTAVPALPSNSRPPETVAVPG